MNRKTRESTFRSTAAFLLAVSFAVSPFAPTVHAATTPKQAGVVTEQSVYLLNLAPGKRATVRISVKNTGTATWVQGGAQRTGLNALNFYRPLTMNSAIKSKGWMTPWRPVRMKEAKVRTGESAHFVFVAQAPTKPGLYHQAFGVAHAETDLVPGTGFRIAVASGKKYTYADLFRGRRLDASTVVTASATTDASKDAITLSFKNTGRWTWDTAGTTAVVLKASNAALLPTGGWVDAATPAVLAKPVKPGQTAQLTFPLHSPSIPGTYNPTFTLYAGRFAIDGTATTIPIVIGGVGGIAEPTMRVGIFTTTQPSMVTASTDVAVADSLGTTLGTLPAGTTLAESFDPATNTHTALFGSTTVTTTADLRLVGSSPDTVLTLTSYSDPACKSTCTFNTFRQTLEFHYAPSRSELWAINELPLEWYLKGVAESSNTAAPELIKTIMTAARSYAFWHINKNTKRSAWGFTLMSSSADQVYLGYEYEQKAPNVATAVDATRGIMVFHPGAVKENNPFGVALTAYSACTDGRTRSYSERFGGDQSLWPWLVSVPDPNGICINSTYLAGGGGNHMVGLSGNGAKDMAMNGSTFDQILPYYYSGASVAKIY